LSIFGNADGAEAREEISTAEYWVSQIESPVRFAAGIASLSKTGATAFVELGPKPVLLGLGQACLPDMEASWLPSLKEGDDGSAMVTSLAKLYVFGARLDWPSVGAASPGRRVTLPTYPFQRERYWLEPVQRGSLAAGRPMEGALGLSGVPL